MTKEQFLSAMGDIDDKFIKEITGAPAILDKPRKNFIIDEEPQVVYLTNERIPFWKIAVSAAAAVCILTAGLFAMVRLHERVPADTSLDVSLSSPEISSSSKPTISTMSTVSDEQSSTVSNKGFTDNFELESEPREANVFTEGAVKSGTFENDASVTVHYGVDPDRPITFSVWDSPDELNGTQLTEAVTVTGDKETVYLPYIDQESKPTNEQKLYLHAYSEFSFNIVGKWTP